MGNVPHSRREDGQIINDVSLELQEATLFELLSWGTYSDELSLQREGVPTAFILHTKPRRVGSLCGVTQGSTVCFQLTGPMEEIKPDIARLKSLSKKLKVTDTFIAEVVGKGTVEPSFFGALTRKNAS